MTSILPFPFCGSEGSTTLVEGLWRVGCGGQESCLGRAAHHTTYGWADRDEAIAEWNKRQSHLATAIRTPIFERDGVGNTNDGREDAQP